MKHTSAIVAAVGLAFVATLLSAPVMAQNARSFVSGHGSDTNPCTLTSPCRTFAQALTMTNAGGEIDMLDPAGYGSMTITKAISIVNDGVGTVGVIVPSSGTGILVNAGVNDAISLRGLSIEGNGIGQTGIQFSAGKSLTIENCVIRHVTGDAIDFNPNASSSLAVSNSLFADNGGTGTFVAPSGSGGVTAVFNHVETNDNAVGGIFMDGAGSIGTITATVSESVAARNATFGFLAETSSGHAPTTLMLVRSVAANNNIGIEAQGNGAALRVAQSTVTGSPASGWLINGGIIYSYGDNYMDGNGGNTGTLTSVVKQ